jgi:hypothetical protein
MSLTNSGFRTTNATNRVINTVKVVFRFVEGIVVRTIKMQWLALQIRIRGSIPLVKVLFL